MSVPTLNPAIGVPLWIKSNLLFQYFHHSVGLPRWLGGKESACSAEDVGEMNPIFGPGSSPGEGNGNPLQYSCLGNPMDRGAWWATVHGVAKSQTWLSKQAHTHIALYSSQTEPPRASWAESVSRCCWEHLTLTASDLDENRQAFLEESFHYGSHDGRFKDLLGNQRTRQLSMQKPRFTSGQSGNTGQGKQLCIFWVQEKFCSPTSVPYIGIFFHTNPDNKSGSALGVRASRLIWQNPTGKTVAVERGIKPSGVDRGEVSLGWKMCLWLGQGRGIQVGSPAQDNSRKLSLTEHQTKKQMNPEQMKKCLAPSSHPTVVHINKRVRHIWAWHHLHSEKSWLCSFQGLCQHPCSIFSLYFFFPSWIWNGNKAWEGGSLFTVEGTDSKVSFARDFLLASENEARNEGDRCLCITCCSICFKHRQYLVARAASISSWYF